LELLQIVGGVMVIGGAVWLNVGGSRQVDQ